MTTREDTLNEAKKFANYLESKCTSNEDITPIIAQTFINGIGWFKKSIWHDGSEEPKKNGMYLVYASYEYEDYPEDNYSEYTTSAWHGNWTEDHFPSDADVTIQKWCNIEDITI